MEPLHIILFLVGVVLCVIVIMVVNGHILAKKRKKTKLGLVKVAGAGIDIGDGDSVADNEADDAVAAAADTPPPDVAAEPESDDTVAVPLDYVEVDVDEEAVETMAMPMSAVMNDPGASKSAGKEADESSDGTDNDKQADNKKSSDNKKTPDKKELSAAPKKRLPETVSMKDRMVLLVEDVEVNRELVTMFFEDTGVKFDSAENGLKAYEKFEKNPSGYSLILMDIQMPGMDGYDTARKIRALDVDWAKQIPIIAMTANVFKEDIDACFDAGMDAHVAKPLDMEELRDKVFEFIAMSTE